MCWNANMFICKECLNIALLLFPTVIFDFSFLFLLHLTNLLLIFLKTELAVKWNMALNEAS